MLDGGTNCGKGGTTMAAVHGPGGPLVVLCVVQLDQLRHGPTYGVTGPYHATSRH